METKNELQETKKREKTPSLMLSLVILIISAVIILSGVLVYGSDVHIMLVFSAIIAGVVGVLFLGVTYDEIESSVMEGILTTMQACLILWTVGCLIGTWITGGVVPSLIYYGLFVLRPSIFLLATFIICTIVSLATGTSWGTAGTVGIALMGIAIGLGVPEPLTVGIILSGAYCGDKMSPLSDTTNLAPAVAGTDLFQHIRAMCWTTGPTYAIVGVITVIIGVKYAGGELDMSKITALQSILHEEFWISPLTFIAPIAVIGLSAAHKPAIPSLWVGVIIGAFFMLFNGYNYGDILDALQNGYHPAFSAELAGAAEDAGALSALLAQHAISVPAEAISEAANDIVSLVERGGMQSMNWTVSLIICAFTFGYTMRVCGYLEVIIGAVTSRVSSVGGLILSVNISCFITNFFLGDQYLGIALPGTMFKETFDKVGLHPRMLSRSLEDSGTLTSALIPWNTCGAYHSTVLGVPTLEYAPYAILNWLNPIVAVAMTYIGIGIFWRGKDGEPVHGGKTRPADLVETEPAAA